MLVSQLGPEHFGNAIFRRGLEGPRIAASGNRILEWPVRADTPVKEVVAPGKGDYSNGACAFDINGDNIDEMVVGRSGGKEGTDLLWFEEVKGESRWKEHFIAGVRGREGDAEKSVHDIMPFEPLISGTKVHGIAIVIARKRLYWFQAPDDPRQPWIHHDIADLGNMGIDAGQSGLVSGDIAGNSRPDLACGNFWFECPEDPSTGIWKVHRYSNWDEKPLPQYPGVPEWVKEQRFGGMNQLELGDMDNDGNADIIAAEAEIPGARLGIFYRISGNPGPDMLWKEISLDTGLYCPHSLVVVDVNSDKLPDIIVGEMTAGGWYFPRNPQPEIFLYLNQGDLKFQKYIFHTGHGVHMMRLAWLPPDNNLFIFAADEIQSWYKDMNTHVIGWTITPI
jgi:hypothetical protein